MPDDDVKKRGARTPEVIEGLQGLPPLVRWRLVLGEAGDACTGGGALGGDAAAADSALGWLYGRDEEGAADREMGRTGGSGPSQMTVPDWISEVHRLFPKETIDVRCF